MKTIILIAVLLLIGCTTTPRYGRYVTRPDGSYKLVPCEKEEANTVDGTRGHLDMYKLNECLSKKYDTMFCY
jgi:hypothetical protein